MVSKEQLFDNDFYYEQYPDVLEAVELGAFRNGYDHWIKHGKSEGREVRFKDEIEVMINQSNEGWGNHLTLRGWVEPKKIEIPLNMIEVPEEFQPVQEVVYPPRNEIPFERYFTQKFRELKPDTFRTYLPIHWTAYYVNSGYKTNQYMQSYLDSLDYSTCSA